MRFIMGQIIYVLTETVSYDDGVSKTNIVMASFDKKLLNDLRETKPNDSSSLWYDITECPVLS